MPHPILYTSSPKFGAFAQSLSVDLPSSIRLAFFSPPAIPSSDGRKDVFFTPIGFAKVTFFLECLPPSKRGGEDESRVALPLRPGSQGQYSPIEQIHPCDLWTTSYNFFC